MGTLAVLKFKAAVKFKVQYVAGFSDVVHGYSYFLTVQPPSFDPRSTNPSSSETESKLIQVSHQVHRCFAILITDRSSVQVTCEIR